MTKKNLFTVTEAAKILGLSVSRVRKLCADRRMGEKVGSTWIITAAELQENTDRPGPGRPSRKH